MTLLETAGRVWSVPFPHRVVDLAMSDGAIIRLRHYGRPGRLRIALSHGNGLAINAYLPFWLPLADELEIVLFDIRNHGENPLHDPSAHHWPRIARDIGEIFEGIQASFGKAPTVGAFHSLSAVATIMHESGDGPTWAALALFDPPLFPPDGHPLQPLQRIDMADAVSRARTRSVAFDSPAQFATQLARRSAFSRWIEGAHLLFAQSTLRADGNGRWSLRHPRELEARIYGSNVDPTLWLQLCSLSRPITLIAADPACADNGPPARICRALHDELGIDYRVITGTTHFLQLEEPALCRDALKDFLRRNGLH